ncbi:hypothetical protein CHCC15337_1696 [Bacillus paralicheniformis]|nr:hypothetical protein CHCC5021_1088 [Bacillus paralicheniformis]TWL07018.1 hypothetical protein CHCC19468_3285 [Bacillus paralicheniformis]TWL08760.1 hypothetical protein CHCC19467_4355 [Bacillus paralicheniformis]TWL40598.1 hypothetical protein CHCC15337_1696 [Bacillus paralicheniformis]TWL53802.1 hypothetical protein CHCC15332_0734 [Bacillus paralicheniformis]
MDFFFHVPRPSPPLYWFVPKAGKHVTAAKYPLKKFQKFCTKLLNSLPKSFKMKEDRRVYFFGAKMNEYSFKVGEDLSWSSIFVKPPLSVPV